MNKKVLIITGAGLAIGFAEALIYYNLGKNSENEKFKLQVPKGAELLKTTGIIIATSLATAALSNIIEGALTEKQELIPIPA
ncbi:MULTISPECIES: hypothetical protein [Flavobacteriaceae]|jgi:hypothetical protein|uniref:hypothetical protein n=1 Tax=Flavobacteriaceae TaxID=49546 RepID=UPI0011990C4D|nr:MULTISPECIES: hypothetical protein [Flavobacteriaceae]MCD9620373.1 hypothetical protein [Tenacibaculum maritimum]MCD9626704.1 hypothetical protein [Tenacibaculum maritimum]MCD9629101.1 hypothetical protein [Tenacibaculum maritimum]MCD9632514.1 hypothetical protein [Tenacibaculum maritimum]TVZ51241.1 hypothetical protein OD90_0377 [Dokdonia sp. Hel_I_53]